MNFVLSENVTSSIHNGLFAVLNSKYPNGLEMSGSCNKSLKYPGPDELHNKDYDDTVTISLKNGISLAGNDEVLEYCWERILFRTYQLLYSGPLKTCSDHQHAFALGLLCIGICIWSNDEKKKEISESILFYIDLMMEKSIGLLGFSSIRFTPPSDLFLYFNKYNRTMLTIIESRQRR